MVRAWINFVGFAAAAILAAVAAPAAAETPRQLLVSAAFGTSDKAKALTLIDQAINGADTALRRNPADREARLQRAVAISYRGKLKRSRADLVVARKAFQSLVASDPHDAEAQLALGGWHLGAVIEVGALVAQTALGAKRATGLQALERAGAGGGGRALFPAFASLTRIQLDPHDVPTARRLAEAAVKARASSPIDKIMQRQAAALLPSLRSGNGKAAAKAATLLLPFGRLRK